MPQKGEKCSPELLAKLRQGKIGEKNPMFGRPSPMRGRKQAPDHTAKNTGEQSSRWKGDDVGYGGAHGWVQKHFPKTGTCEKCGRTPKRIAYVHYGKETTRSATEYANISGKYLRDRKDYMELCIRCHRQLDVERRKHAST